MKKPDLHIVSFSGGKDSTAMLLHMMELGMQIDIVLYCDTWMEFPAMYRHVEKVKKIVEDAAFAVMVILGVVNDPTTDGLSDSKQALTYTEPKKEGE